MQTLKHWTKFSNFTASSIILFLLLIGQWTLLFRLVTSAIRLSRFINLFCSLFFSGRTLDRTHGNVVVQPEMIQSLTSIVLLLRCPSVAKNWYFLFNLLIGSPFRHVAQSELYESKIYLHLNLKPGYNDKIWRRPSVILKQRVSIVLDN